MLKMPTIYTIKEKNTVYVSLKLIGKVLGKFDK